MGVSFIIFKHGTVIRIGTTCKKIPCYMRRSARKWSIAKNAKKTC